MVRYCGDNDWLRGRWQNKHESNMTMNEGDGDNDFWWTGRRCFTKKKLFRTNNVTRKNALYVNEIYSFPACVYIDLWPRFFTVDYFPIP